MGYGISGVTGSFDPRSVMLGRHWLCTEHRLWLQETDHAPLHVRVGPSTERPRKNCTYMALPMAA